MSGDSAGRRRLVPAGPVRRQRTAGVHRHRRVPVLLSATSDRRYLLQRPASTSPAVPPGRRQRLEVMSFLNSVYACVGVSLRLPEFVYFNFGTAIFVWSILLEPKQLLAIIMTALQQNICEFIKINYEFVR